METTSFDSKEVDVNLKEFIEINTEWLSEKLDPDFGLLDDLLRSRVLSMKETSQIKCLPESFARSEKLLTIVLKKDVHEKFIESLRSNKQTHLANFIVANGEHKSTFGDDWPLTDKEIQTLDTNRGALVDLLETSDLLFLLYSKNVINIRQREEIESKPTSHKKNELLLDILRRKSLNDYRVMIDCLCASYQSHIAQILKDGEVILAIHAELETPDVEKAEQEIVMKLTDILSCKTLKACNRILEKTKLRLLEVKKGHSVVVYIHIKTLQELICIEEDVASGKLATHVIELFNHLLCRPTITRLKKMYIDLPKDAYYKAVQLLSVKCQEELVGHSEVVEQENTRKNQTDAHINDLPLELIDIVLQSAILLHMLNKESQTSTTDFIRKLLSVEHCWFQRITRRRLKRTIWRILPGLIERNKRKSTIIRNNAAYLLENIHPEQIRIKPEMAQPMQCLRTKLFGNIRNKKLSTTLRKEDCLNDVQTRLIKSIDRNISKNAELLHMLRSVGDERYNVFVQSLRASNQRTVKRVIDMGGVVVKLQLESNRSPNKKATHQMLLQKLNDLGDKKKPRSEQTGKILLQLYDNKMEILNSVNDRQTMVWIWCQSQEALRKLQTMTEDNSLSDYFSKLFESSSLTKEQDTVRDETKIKKDEIKETVSVNIDKDQLRKQVVNYELVINLCTTLKRVRGCRVVGVTKLKDRIFVLHRPNVILIFEDRSPFELKETFESNGVKDPSDIASDEKENCIYVIAGNGSLWKLTDDHKVIQLSRNLPGGPYTISVSNDGHLVIVSNNPASLGIYGPDGEQLRSYLLPIDFRNPLHAIETSSENFVILHEWLNQTKHQWMWMVSELTVANGTLYPTRRFVPNDEPVRDCGIKKHVYQNLKVPIYLSLDFDDRVFVAEEGIARVTVLDSDLNWVQHIRPPNPRDIFYPRRMCYDRENNQLIVVVNRGADVNVYSLGKG